MGIYNQLFTPGQIGSVTIKNRVVMTAMGVDLADCDGQVNEKTIAYYAERARRNVGLIITEYCRVEEGAGACATGQLSLAEDRHISGMERLVSAVHEGGAKIFIQLHHPGRQTHPIFPTYWKSLEQAAQADPEVWQKFFDRLAGKGSQDESPGKSEVQPQLQPALAPSVIPPEEDDGPLRIVKIRAFTTEEIHELVGQFIDAAERAKKAGADGVELHAAHGYLLQQFLSPYTNRRTDAYGGSLENRCRIINEMIAGIHERCGADFPVIVRLSVAEFMEMIGHPDRGYGIDEGVRMAKELEKGGADGINVSVAGNCTTFLVTESVRHALLWRAPLIKRVKEAVSVPVIGVGVIRTPEQAEQLLESGNQDFIGLGRPFLADPMWAEKAAKGEEKTINRCISCLACMDSFSANMLNEKPIDCALNPRTCHETEYAAMGEKDGAKRKVIVVGAGPAGLMAARELAYRDFDVCVLEKAAVPGGQINEADKPPFKARLQWCIEDLERQVLDAGARIRCGVTVTRELIDQQAPYAVILATGASAFKPAIPGAEQDFVYITTPILMGEVAPKNEQIVVAGSGMTGLETAEMLADAGNTVTVIEMADKIAQGLTGINVGETTAALTAKGVRFMTGTKLLSIGDHQVVAAAKDGQTVELPASRVVLSLGSKKNDALAAELSGGDYQVYLVGDAASIGRIADATRSAYETARKLK